VSGSHTEETPSPYAVILASLAVPVPDVSPEARAALVVEALTRFGHLTAPDAPVTLTGAREAAQWLADASGHLRYTATVDGWRKLLQSEGDIHMAATAATIMADETDKARIHHTRAILVRAVRTGVTP
jgi:hypothetical protein